MHIGWKLVFCYFCIVPFAFYFSIDYWVKYCVKSADSFVLGMPVLAGLLWPICIPLLLFYYIQGFALKNNTLYLAYKEYSLEGPLYFANKSMYQNRTQFIYLMKDILDKEKADKKFHAKIKKI